MGALACFRFFLVGGCLLVFLFICLGGLVACVVFICCFFWLFVLLIWLFVLLFVCCCCFVGECGNGTQSKQLWIFWSFLVPFGGEHFLFLVGSWLWFAVVQRVFVPSGVLQHLNPTGSFDSLDLQLCLWGKQTQGNCVAA